MLLVRDAVTPLAAMRRLLAMQAQFPRAPFIGLWSRLAAFAPDDLLQLIRRREVVRATWVRATLHLTAADDFIAFRPLLRTEQALRLPNGVHTTQADQAELLDLARQHFAAPHDFESLRDVIPGDDTPTVRNLAYAARILLPLVQPDADTAWGHKPGGEFVLVKAWLGRDIAAAGDIGELVRRYLAAYGPATPADFTSWSGIKGAAALFEALGDQLVRFHDPRKRVLFDLPDAPRPDPDTPAPPRLLPDFDGAVLGHQDRTRIIPTGHAAHVATSKNLLIPSLVLVDGFVVGAWRLEVKRKAATLTLRMIADQPAKMRQALEAEAVALITTFEPAATPAVTFAEA
jgi:hypothetical protein